MIGQGKISAIIDLLVSGALGLETLEQLTADLGTRLLNAGMPLDYFALYTLSINPVVYGRRIYWTPRRGVRVLELDHAEIEGIQHQGSVVQGVNISKRSVRYRIGSDPKLDAHPSTQQFANAGMSEIFAAPLTFREVQDCAFAAATRCMDGFSPEDIIALRRIQAPLARVAEASVLHGNTISVLSTYVGRDAGKAVLDGRVVRGDMESIPAVILFADLKNFTQFSNTAEPEAVISRLNRFFEVAEQTISRNGGEVLKLIGDGLLAIFQTPDDLTAQSSAAANALSAITDAQTELAAKGIEFRAALHIGDIHYGNIGSSRRLDFTAIGPAVNLTSRLLAAADDCEADFVCSEAFREIRPDHTEMASEMPFKGFDARVPVYRVSLS